MGGRLFKGTAALALAGAALAAPAGAEAQDDPRTCSGEVGGSGPGPKPGAPPLRFGIFPGGPAGQVGPPQPAKPESASKILDALGQLRGGDRPFVVHLYRHWVNPAADAAEEREERILVDRYTRRGYLVEYVIRYKPDPPREGDVAAYAEFVRGVVRRFGSNRRVKGFQITNEVNQPTSPDSSDGPFRGSRDALIQGVIAAKEEARRLGYDQLEIGFNWFYRTDPQREGEFWTHLRDRGGPRFVRSLDWIGLDAYPGTFFPPAGFSERTSMINAFSVFRCFSKSAGIPKTVPIHIQENGWPTGPGRSYAQQAENLEEMVRVSHEYRRTYNVTDYRWFDLRDADSSNPTFTQQFGIMRDDYTPKPAFPVYRRLIDQLAEAPNCADRAGPRTGIRRRSARWVGRRWSGRRSGRGPLRRLAVSGTATDRGCRQRDGRLRTAGVRRVEVAVVKGSPRRCRFLAFRGRLSRRRRCRRPIWLRATGSRRWRLSRRARLPRGRYKIVVRAVDGAGNGGHRARVRVRVR